MNITLLRRIQMSIADETRPFDMNRWDYCIAGHCHRAQRGEFAGQGEWNYVAEDGRAALGLNAREATELFHSVDEPHRNNRSLAIQRIDRFIEAYEQQQAALAIAAAAIAQADPEPQSEPEPELTCV